MASSREAFSIGDIQCVAISDGTFSYPVEWIFSNAPKEQLEDSLRNHDLPMNQVVTPYTCLLVKAGKQKVLIDTGADGLAHFGRPAETVASRRHNSRRDYRGGLDPCAP
jgi:hypothetical protein